MNWSSTLASCVTELTLKLRYEHEAKFEQPDGYPLGWRVYGVPRAIAKLRARGFDAWVENGDVVHARRADASLEGVHERRRVLVSRR